MDLSGGDCTDLAYVFAARHVYPYRAIFMYMSIWIPVSSYTLRVIQYTSFSKASEQSWFKLLRFPS